MGPKPAGNVERAAAGPRQLGLAALPALADALQPPCRGGVRQSFQRAAGAGWQAGHVGECGRRLGKRLAAFELGQAARVDVHHRRSIDRSDPNAWGGGAAAGRRWQRSVGIGLAALRC
ncbi:hypothetical protein H7U16_25985 [Klebsiella pneumoniae]|uniref:Uncharacterized protein n=1 Tax=Klebsiella pneumoniae TaxID=573 RepID=A0A7X1LPA9_KLEPN|nr:hypothetical protein [Klebsiella pneumoniae]